MKSTVYNLVTNKQNNWQILIVIKKQTSFVAIILTAKITLKVKKQTKNSKNYRHFSNPCNIGTCLWSLELDHF